jgi:hypothetical protein
MQQQTTGEMSDEEKRAYRALARAAKRVQDIESLKKAVKPASSAAPSQGESPPTT